MTQKVKMGQKSKEVNFLGPLHCCAVLSKDVKKSMANLKMKSLECCASQQQFPDPLSTSLIFCC